MQSNGLSYELILVNDGSPDNSWEALVELSKQQANIVAINLGKNYGQHNALVCGLSAVQGDFVVTMDDDLQHAPEEIPRLVSRLNKEVDVVLASWKSKKHGKVQNAGSRFMTWLTNRIFASKKQLQFSAFRVIRRQVVDEMIQMHTQFPFIDGMIMQITDKIVNVEIEHQERKHGSSNYSYSKLVSLAFNLLINYSSIPIRVVSFAGVSVSILSFILGLIYLIQKIIVGEAPLGWTTLALMLSFYNGVLFLILAILGEYLSRILAELGRNRRAFTIKEIIRSSDK